MNGQAPAEETTTEQPTPFEQKCQQVTDQAQRALAALRAVHAALGDGFSYDVSLESATVFLHCGIANFLPTLRRVRRAADGPIVDRGIFPERDGKGASVHVSFAIGGERVVVVGYTHDYRRFIKPGMACREEAAFKRVVCH